MGNILPLLEPSCPLRAGSVGAGGVAQLEVEFAHQVFANVSGCVPGMAPRKRNRGAAGYRAAASGQALFSPQRG